MRATNGRKVGDASASNTEAAAADRLDAVDLAELSEAVAKAQRAEQELLRTQEQAAVVVQQARDRAVGALHVHDYVLTRIRAQYEIPADGVISPDGTIVRDLSATP